MPVMWGDGWGGGGVCVIYARQHYVRKYRFGFVAVGMGHAWMCSI